MTLLLDTHTFLWFIMGDARLSQTARAVIENPANVNYFSAASAWEIAIKTSLGKLSLTAPFEILVPREIRKNGFILLPIELTHVSMTVNLAFHHRDPFDRMIIAQAMCEGMDIVSADTAFDSYGVKRIW